MPQDKRARKLYEKAYRRDHKEEKSAYLKKYYQEHREELLAKARQKAAEKKEIKMKQIEEDKKNGIWEF